MKVDVYKNLRNGMFSIKARSGQYKGLVVAHARQVWLDDVEFVVSKSGRDRVLREKKKYVHAFVRGTLSSFVGQDLVCPTEFLKSGIGSDISNQPMLGIMIIDGEEFTYNPYRFSTFVDRKTERELHHADHAYLCSSNGTTYL